MLKWLIPQHLRAKIQGTATAFQCIRMRWQAPRALDRRYDIQITSPACDLAVVVQRNGEMSAVPWCSDVALPRCDVLMLRFYTCLLKGKCWCWGVGVTMLTRSASESFTYRHASLHFISGHFTTLQSRMVCDTSSHFISGSFKTLHSWTLCNTSGWTLQNTSSAAAT